MNRPKYGEIKAFDSATERRRCEDLADLYAIARATESLEAIFSRDAVTPAEYAQECTKLISQFKSTESALVSSGAIKSGDAFFKEFQIDFPRAYERLIRTGVPATVIHATNVSSDAVVVAQTTQSFITAMDAIKLDQKAVDQIQPLIKDLTSSLNRVSGIPGDFDALTKMKLWLQKLHQMRASDELQEEEARQLLFDLESSYGAFIDHLTHGKGK